MNLPDYVNQILKLTDKFYNAYPNPPYREIMQKRQRGYDCILFQTHYDYFICVPYRTEISHAYAYHFKNSIRSKKNKSGIDYTKAIIIKNSDYIDVKDALVDKDEYNETMINIDRIHKEVLDYVNDYILHKKGIKKIHEKEYKRRYQYSTLQYFDKELGI